ncbi:ATP-binding protein [Mucilaginibacter sp.]|uniref:ATP-binding protein n=1 Tax=Mucilaginibacter sp. TaxID=1882438 RepID=UPI003AFFE775
MKGNNPDYLLHNVSEISKRIDLIALTTVGIGFFLATVYALLGLYQNGLLVFAFCCGLALLFYLRTKIFSRNFKLPLVAYVGLSLIVFAANEGYGTGQYLYFFPAIISIPIVLGNHKTFVNRVLMYFVISAVCFVVCILIGVFHQPWTYISELNRSRLFFINAVSSVAATMCFAYINISLERKYLQQLIDQKNNTIDARTQFLSTMGHELRTPLNGIIGAVNLLKKTDGLPGQQEYFNILKYCSDQMLFQVNDILDFNKIEAGKLEIHPVEVNLKQLLDKSVMPFINLFEEKNLRLLLDIDPELDQVLMIDDVRIIQILNNLLSNAGKFTNTGYVKLAAKIIGKNSNSVEVKIGVEDTGNGIAKEDQQRVFDTFGQVYDRKTRKITGSGLGLTICNQILHLMDSKMQLKSEKGVGSTFSFNISFSLPVHQVLPKKAIDINPATLSGTKILLVEDNHINMLIARKMLDSFEAKTVSAFNGEEAIACLTENPASFHIVLMDLEMPVMDGYATIELIKKRWQHLPVLAFTATMVDAETLAQLQAIGFKDCIMKPFQAPVLLDQILKYALVPALNLQ